MADLHTHIEAILAEDEQSVTVTIYKPDGEPYLASDGSEATISVLGAESKKVRRARDGILRRTMRSRKLNAEPSEIRKNRIDEATAAIVGWHGWEIDGKPADLTNENIALLLRVDHILVQVENAIAGHSNFFKDNLATLSK